MGRIVEAMEAARAEALREFLDPSEAGLWRRSVRRAVSALGVSLAEAEAMDPYRLFLHVIEAANDLADDEGEEAILEECRELVDPEYSAAKEAQLREAVERAVDDEAEFRASGLSRNKWLLRKMKETKREQEDARQSIAGEEPPLPPIAYEKQFEDGGDPDSPQG